MSAKKVSFGTRPAAPKEQAPTPEAWVDQRHAPEGTKRLTLDIAASLHARIKADCARRGVKMVEELRELLEREYPA
jgi:hypothetical protein